MASAHVVEIFNVISHHHASFNNGSSGFKVEKFGLHSSPEESNYQSDAPIICQAMISWTVCLALVR